MFIYKRGENKETNIITNNEDNKVKKKKDNNNYNL